MNETAIHTENLSRSFGTSVAVDSLSLEVPRGVVFGFLGPNGAGKTTTIRLLLGLLEPTAGRSTVLGFDTVTHGDEIRKRAGALLENTGLYERLSAEDNLDFYGKVYRMPPGERENRIRELLTHFGLWERRKERVGGWSRGMKQKLALARALLHRPALLFLDEPTTGLDPVAAAAFRDDLSKLVSEEGMTVFLTTHNLAEAERVCGLVGVIDRGKLLAVGHPDELRSREEKTHAEITGNGFTERLLSLLESRPEVVGVEGNGNRLSLELKRGAGLAPLVRLIVEEGADIEEVKKGKASLEEAFLKILEEKR